MSIQELEKQIQALRSELGVTYKWLNTHGLSMSSIMAIHHDGNYRMSTLFKYVENLFYVIEADGIVVTDLASLGNVLREKRKKLGYNTIQIQSKLVWPMRQVLQVEKGRGYYKSSLLAYLEVVPVEFNLKNLMDISEEDRQKLFNL